MFEFLSRAHETDDVGKDLRVRRKLTRTPKQSAAICNIRVFKGLQGAQIDVIKAIPQFHELRKRDHGIVARMDSTHGRRYF
jgi:hypothetical protein